MFTSNTEKYFHAFFGLIFGILIGYTIADEAYEGHTMASSILNGSVFLIIYIFLFLIFDRLNALTTEKTLVNTTLSHAKDDDLRHLFLKWNLSSSEIKVFNMLAEGKSVTEIAEIRGSSEKTVRAQMSTIYKKSGIKNQQELLARFDNNIKA